jgi:Cofactor assembly of complex C subunit B
MKLSIGASLIITLSMLQRTVAFSMLPTRTTDLRHGVPIRVLPMEHQLLESLASAWEPSSLMLSADAFAPPETAGISYSKTSYYTVLGLYLMSFPGVWSQIKRSTTAKIKRKTYVSPGEKSGSEKAMTLRQQAGEIMACKCFSLQR